MRRLMVVAGVCVVAACSGSPTDPSDGGSGGPGGSGGASITCPQHVGTATRAQGTMTATINGVNWVADCIAILTNNPAILSIAAADLATGVAFQTFGVAGNRVVGTQTIAVLSPLTSTLVQGTSGWNASSAQGSGTLVVTASTNSSVAGTFTFALLPVPGASNPATGTKTVTGSFNLTF